MPQKWSFDLTKKGELNFWSYFILFFFPLIGGLFSVFIQKNTALNLKLFLAFSGAFLFSVTAISILPQVYSEHTEWNVGYFILVGFFLQIVIDHFSKGIEHGHVHHHADDGFPLSIFLALSLHAILEGIAAGSQYFSHESQMSFVFAIALHEMPAAFALVMILKANQTKRRNLYSWLILYSFMTPLGAAIAHFGLSSFVDSARFTPYLIAVIVGIFLHISTTIIFENSENHKFSRKKLIAICIGVAIALLSTVGHMHSH